MSWSWLFRWAYEDEVSPSLPAAMSMTRPHRQRIRQLQCASGQVTYRNRHLREEPQVSVSVEMAGNVNYDDHGHAASRALSLPVVRGQMIKADRDRREGCNHGRLRDPLRWQRSLPPVGVPRDFAVDRRTLGAASASACAGMRRPLVVRSKQPMGCLCRSCPLPPFERQR